MANYTEGTVKFWIDGISSDTLGVWVDTLSVPPMPKQRYVSWSTRADTNGFYADDTYEDITYSIDFYKFFPTALDDQYIHNYFKNPEKLILSSKPTMFYRITDFSLDPPDNLDDKRYHYRANFRLSPFSYSVDDTLTQIQNGDAIAYIGTRYGKPLIVIKGNSLSDVRITINSTAIEIKDVSMGEILYIDSEQKLVRDNSGQMIYNRVSGKYPYLDAGSNQISWTGDLEYLKIIKNERWL